ncbi:acyl-CoA carboxylase subunit epsilon [Janibacter corallicola]|uniref:acyl-CoA carboxylase subunit epsilon n=1 Tax=Janibacter corallicola TaxID=415212 RepID=UPI000A071727|nr:acyl-CoA carboxylase subunit epsilon [Janibacter corallicola]
MSAAQEDSAQDSGPDPQDAATPAQRIEVRGDATPEQVAALVAVLSGLGGEDEPPAAPTSQWSAPARLVHAPLHPAPGGWRASALPR